MTVKAFDDLGAEADAAITITKGADGGCASAATCLDGQQCTEGRCVFVTPPPPTVTPSGGCAVGVGADAAPLHVALVAFAAGVFRRRRR